MINVFNNANILIKDDFAQDLTKYQKILQYKQRPFVFGYARLSRDDDKEQNSLNNQKGIIRDYAIKNNYDIIDIIADDNVSGMTFDRDGISLLMNLIDAQLVDIILVKDLSRLGRHKAYSELFMQYAKMKNVRIISITENIDASDDKNDLVIGLKQIINEQYAKDISRKIRSGFKQKQKEGLVIIPPFGYIKDKNTNKVVILEECANIVRLIYKLYTQQGMGAKKIARYLSEHNYKTPSTYQKELYNKSVPYTSTINTQFWNDRTVTEILKNDAYIGVLRCNKNYKSTIYKVRKRLPEEEHIVHENFYPPIVDRETWELAQSIRKNRVENNVRASKNSKIHRYAGLLKCGHCNATFVAKKRNGYIEYVCNTYHRRGKDYCSAHRIKESELDDIIYAYLERLKILAEENLLRVDEFIKEWSNRKKDYDKNIEKINLEIITLKEDIKNYAKQLARGLINEEIFKEMTNESNLKIEQLKEQLNSLQEMIEINKNMKKGIRKSVDILNDIVSHKELDDAHLRMLIERIIVHEHESAEFSLDIYLNMPFKYHASLAQYFTEGKDSCVYFYSVIDILDKLCQHFVA